MNLVKLRMLQRTRLLSHVCVYFTRGKDFNQTLFVLLF